MSSAGKSILLFWSVDRSESSRKSFSSLNHNHNLHHHIRTLGSMQSGSVDFVSNVLPLTTHSYSPVSHEPMPNDSRIFSKTNTTLSSTSDYDSTFSHSSVKSRRSLFSRLKRLINFPSTKKSSEYSISTFQNSYELNSPINSSKSATSSSGMNTNFNEHQRNSLTSIDIRRKSARRTLSPTIQHIPFLYGLKNCGNTW